ncbi:hypothetical protein [uncultured Sneathiella sp.]|uniref:hypothetical protein n=1 Tax=uncultured Sneathiella sp. TaxID=879315 RepID=UPI002594F687|nr:hypothetical protein [uncultured Sneathiella sp.]
MGDIKFGRRLTAQGSFVLAVVAAMLVLLSSCVMPPPVPSLHEALLQETGYQLGEKSANLNEERAECAAESRYDGPTGPVLVLVCVAPQNGNDRRIRYRVSYTPPEAGHRIWKIDASLPGATYQDTDILKALAEKYGPGRKLKASETRRWTFDAAHLEVREDQYGVHLMLWDRSLRQG